MTWITLCISAHWSPSLRLSGTRRLSTSRRAWTTVVGIPLVLFTMVVGCSEGTDSGPVAPSGSTGATGASVSFPVRSIVRFRGVPSVADVTVLEARFEQYGFTDVSVSNSNGSAEVRSRLTINEPPIRDSDLTLLGTTGTVNMLLASSRVPAPCDAGPETQQIVQFRTGSVLGCARVLDAIPSLEQRTLAPEVITDGLDAKLRVVVPTQDPASTDVVLSVDGRLVASGPVEGGLATLDGFWSPDDAKVLAAIVGNAPLEHALPVA